MDSAPHHSKRTTIILWTLSGLLALAFLGSGAGKLTGAMTETLNGGLGVPTWAVPLIGAIEIGAAIALLVPRARFYGAAILVGTMVGAVLTHLVAADFAGFAAPLVLGVLSGLVAWMTRPTWVRERLPGASPA